MARVISTLLVLFVCFQARASAQGKLTVTVFDVRARKYVPGIMVQIFALSAHNGQLGSMPDDPYHYSVVVEAVTNSEGKATFDSDKLLPVVDLVNQQLREAPRQLITKHYEIGIYVLRGGQCTYSNQSLHQIMESGVVGSIAPSACKTDVKPQDFHAKPGEIVMFQSHAM